MNRIVVVSGRRTPLLKAFTKFNDVKGFELLRHALIATVNSVHHLDKKDIEYVVAGMICCPPINLNIDCHPNDRSDIDEWQFQYSPRFANYCRLWCLQNTRPFGDNGLHFCQSGDHFHLQSNRLQSDRVRYWLWCRQSIRSANSCDPKVKEMDANYE